MLELDLSLLCFPNLRVQPCKPRIARSSRQKEQVLIYTMTKQSHQSTTLWFAPKQDCHTLARLQAIFWKPPALPLPVSTGLGRGKKKETCSASLTLSQAVSTEREEQLARHFLLCSRPPRAKLLGSLNIHTNTPLLSGFCSSCPSLFYLSILSRRNHTKSPVVDLGMKAAHYCTRSLLIEKLSDILSRKDWKKSKHRVG